jgi:hypothetical protein
MLRNLHRTLISFASDSSIHAAGQGARWGKAAHHDCRARNPRELSHRLAHFNVLVRATHCHLWRYCSKFA